MSSNSDELPARTLLSQKARVLLFLMRHGGPVVAVQLMEFIEDWLGYLESHGGVSPPFERYAKWTTKLSYRTAYRRLALLRKTFPTLGPDVTPDVFLTPAIERLVTEEAMIGD
jgi:hypothetical protein